MSTPPPATPPTRLERPLHDRKIAGVCAAIARHQRVDPLVVRIVAVALVLLGGFGVIAYFAGMMLIPAEGSEEPLIREGLHGSERAIALILGIAATVALFGFTTNPFDFFGSGGGAWIAVAAVIGVAVVVLRRERQDAAPPPASGSPPATGTTMVATGWLGDTPETAETAVIPPAPRRSGRSAAIVGAALLLIAATGGVFAAVGGDVRWDVALCSSVIVLGVALVASAPFGGARVLVPFGLFLAVLAGGAAAADLNLRGGAGDHLEHPAALASGTTEYNQAAGRLVVDLRDASLGAGVTKVKAEIGFGQVLVRVPDHVRVELKGHASAGDVEIFGRDSNGFDARRAEVLPGSDPSTTLQIDAHAGFGQVRFVSASHPLPEGRGGTPEIEGVPR